MGQDNVIIKIQNISSKFVSDFIHLFIRNIMDRGYGIDNRRIWVQFRASARDVSLSPASKPGPPILQAIEYWGIFSRG
jgi:hypothetical protein